MSKIIPTHALTDAAEAAGAIDVSRVVASIQLAVRNGMPIDDALAALRRNQPQLFDDYLIGRRR
jgi:hypothetical protein